MATGCLEVSTCISEYTAWKIPWIHTAFENAAATLSGVETMYRSLSRLAVNTCYWPLYEIENGVAKVTFNPKEKLPIADFMKPQGRFKHLFAPENEWLLKKVQEEVDAEWEKLQKEAKCG